MQNRDWIKLIIWIVIFEAIGFCLGKVTQSNLETWYVGLNKSTLTPPGFVFAIVWSILYALIAMVSWILWQNRNKLGFQKLVYLNFTQLIMNWAWTPFFFSLHWVGFSFLWIVIMVVLNGILIVELKKEKKWLAFILTPYFLWLIFAAYLNGVIWIGN